MADSEIKPEEVAAECNDRLDRMVSGIVLTAREQGARALGAIDLVRINRTFEQQRISDFMLRYLAATAVTRLVNIELAGSSDVPNT